MKLKSEIAATAIMGAFATVAISLLSVGCSSVKIDEGTYPVGVMLPLSGEDSEAAREVLRGMEMARDEINSSGGVSGVKMSLVLRDMAAKDFDFVDTFNALRRSGVKVLNIGFDKEVILRHKAISGCDDIFVNYLCTYPPVTIGSKNSTRIFLNGAQQGDIMASAVDADQKGERQLVIMNVDNFYGKSNADYLSFCLKTDKVKIYRDVFGSAEKDFDIFSTQIKRLWAEYVFYVGNGATLPDFVSSLAKCGYDKAVVANCGFLNFNFVPPNSLELLRIETLFQQGKLKGEVSRRFAANYKMKYAKDASWMAACGYDSIVLLARAASKQRFNPASMRGFFSNMKCEGAMGSIEFDASADTTMQIELVRQK